MNPIYCVGCLHMGAGGPRDNFAAAGKESDFVAWLDMVQDTAGRLVLGGDVLELWQENLSKVICHRMPFLDRFGAMNAQYILGNHECDLLHFVGTHLLNHSLFRRMTTEITLPGAIYREPEYALADDRERRRYWTPVRYDIRHGHEADPACSGDSPGLGRITALYTALREDRNHGPLLRPLFGRYRTVENRSLGWMEWLADAWSWLRGEPGREIAINRAFRAMRREAQSATTEEVVFLRGHTHSPGRSGTWLYNWGSWAEQRRSYVRIDEHGPRVLDWVDRLPVEITTELPL